MQLILATLAVLVGATLAIPDPFLQCPTGSRNATGALCQTEAGCTCPPWVGMS